MIYSNNSDSADAAIGAWDCPNVQILHNTCRTVNYMDSIEYRFSTCTGVVIENNLCNNAIISRDGAVASLSGNNTAAQDSWFNQVAVGDLHLDASATPAFAAGVFPVANCTDDWDGNPRPTASAPDCGAHQYNAVGSGTTGTTGTGTTGTSTGTSGTGTGTSTGTSGTGTTSTGTSGTGTTSTGGSGVTAFGGGGGTGGGGGSSGGCGVGGSLGMLLGLGLWLGRRPRRVTAGP